MKKFFNKNMIIGFIAGAIIFSGITVFAVTKYSSDNILYKKGNEDIVLTDVLDNLNNYINYGNASASDIAPGKTALVNGKKITGEMLLGGNYTLVLKVGVQNKYCYWSNYGGTRHYDEDAGGIAYSQVTVKSVNGVVSYTLDTNPVASATPKTSENYTDAENAQATVVSIEIVSLTFN